MLGFCQSGQNGMGEDGANPGNHFVGSQLSVGFDNFSFGMDPERLNCIQPGALFGQQAYQQSHALPRLLDLTIMLAQPCDHGFAHMPGGMVPKEDEYPLAASQRFGADPLQILDRQITAGISVHKP